MKPYLAAAIQMTSKPDLSENLIQAEEWIELAQRRGCKLIALPENFAYMGDEAEKAKLAPEIARRAEEFLRKMAQRFQAYVLGGGYPVPTENNKVFNTASLIGPDGRELARYQKVHLFDVNLPDGNTYRESNTVMPGQDIQSCYVEELGTLGLSVCYDVRFPELYRTLASQGADVLAIPAAFTAFTGKDHWQVLVQARAIENTCYAIAPAQVGRHYQRRQTHGHAAIVDPWGVILADAGGEKPGLAIAEIDPARLQQVRRQMPSLQHRRLSAL
ncbi:carbon-nitrogen hydrolase family protein [Synechococcus sp. PCC 7336]|uniref:carbon-nitrogen hydrolase family protein n=1 Tax=Synechococcus sp. PCC 7336 TaxID=195250 RepID=UPI00034837D1|nr:carbon-nitrogen hydrolase family protein [Synechococcus sp. PCC 7336]